MDSLRPPPKSPAHPLARPPVDLAAEPLTPAYESRFLAPVSLLLVCGTLLLVMWLGLLPGLLCVCMGFLGTRWLSRVMDRTLRGLRRWPRDADGRPRGAPGLAATLGLLAPVVVLILLVTRSSSLLLDAPAQYRNLLDFIARTVLELRQKLPREIGATLPEGAADVQRVFAGYLRAEAGALAHTGGTWLNALLFAYVGLVIGTLAAVHSPTPRGPLAEQLRRRAHLFGEAFHQIVAAQFWIAATNTVFTAIFLLFALPMWQQQLPYTPLLIALTFLAGLVPIVGNLVCNAVITLVGLSVSPTTAFICLAFLVLIHKAEYLINAKVVGSRTEMRVWELLTVMFIAEAAYGPPGLVAAPLFYAYLKKELKAAKLI
ncbi:AI-2E family transporter [Variovorax humicola]|uniref:AI-2E family transporter n=1 Tax=Variovorax humicola TaxID=1769758 RepID=A0ABU8W488_9BURK